MANAGGCLDSAIYYSKKFVDSLLGRLAGITGYSATSEALVFAFVATSEEEFGKEGVSGVDSGFGTIFGAGFFKGGAWAAA